jgi:hypothetical protein
VADFDRRMDNVSPARDITSDRYSTRCPATLSRCLLIHDTLWSISTGEEFQNIVNVRDSDKQSDMSDVYEVVCTTVSQLPSTKSQTFFIETSSLRTCINFRPWYTLLLLLFLIKYQHIYFSLFYNVYIRSKL